MQQNAAQIVQGTKGSKRAQMHAVKTWGAARATLAAAAPPSWEGGFGT